MVIIEYSILLIVSKGQHRHAAVNIQLYKFKRLHSALELQSNVRLLLIGLDAECEHWIMVCISANYSFHGGRIYVG
jgi:hypothetical protein